MVTEQRRHERADATLEVEYTLVRRISVNSTTDLSAGGMFVATEMPNPIGTELEFNFEIPGYDRSIQVRGEVVRIVWTGKGVKSGMGIRFTRIHPDDRSAIRLFVEEINS